MRPEDIQKTKLAIQQASILSSVEKAEWIQLLPEMNDKEVNELVGILLSAQVSAPKPTPPLPPPAPVQIAPVTPPFPTMPVSIAKVPLPPQPHVDIKQKEISTSIPFYELELPEHAGVKPVVPAPVATVHVPVNGKVMPAPTDPTELQNRVGNIVRELQQKKEPTPAPSPVVAPPIKPVVEKPEPIHGEPLVLKTPEDFAKIEPKNMHGDDPYVELQTILTYMTQIGQRNKIYQVIDNFEKSPLYRTYMNIGLALLNDASPDRDAAYNNVLNTMQRMGQQWLSKDEFEAFADFRKRLDQMV